MDLPVKLLEMLGAHGPSYIILAILIIAFWKSGALKEMFAKTKNTIKSENEIARIPQEGRYVLRDDCHSHIDMLTSKIALIKEETCEIKKDVRMLVEAAIKK